MIGAAMGLNRLETLRAAGHVRRYHNEYAGMDQNNADHTWHVMTMNIMLEPRPSAELLKHAHGHDLPEVFTGDFPAPVKWECAGLKEMLTKLEERGLKEIEWDLPALTLYEQQLLKWCDGAELCLTSYEHVKRGNRAAMRPFGFVIVRLQEMLEQDRNVLRNNLRVMEFMESLKRMFYECQ